MLLLSLLNDVPLSVLRSVLLPAVLDDVPLSVLSGPAQTICTGVPRGSRSAR